MLLTLNIILGFTKVTGGRNVATHSSLLDFKSVNTKADRTMLRTMCLEKSRCWDLRSTTSWLEFRGLADRVFCWKPEHDLGAPFVRKAVAMDDRTVKTPRGSIPHSHSTLHEGVDDSQNGL
eukprot:195905-Pelagomonas_calceolata.AAC.2